MVSPSLIYTFVNALHILHYNGVLDAYGHLSMRNPDNSSTFLMARGGIAPALVSSSEDIIEFLIADASPVDPNAPKPVMERHIHSEIYKRFSGINSVVHSHSPAVLPYAISNVPLRAAIHMAGFVGEEVPVFDISKYYSNNDTQDLLVTNVRLGAALAAEFSANSSQATALPNHSIVLMQSHGFAGCAADIKTVVYQAIYTQRNAQVLSDALNLEHAFGGSTNDIIYLTPQEAIDSYATIGQNFERPWSLWVREVEVSPLYENSVNP
ncbi:class II aldolase and Adducin N-terminal domain-containing protein [Xylaria bambusicola]|uniref:class II aldolase and Adducin N-terminal domain-containing protein n=1 Tax=Xylaria bambusicola TaxID=326684 RepID=UPI002008479E|nr:class II aldolase and Adducin N-terminal domain-containing protein [Xylaria bambusicola]KAI0525738.1 class II aldolase and Adducin N-terminal domain-containing protein [Xylaria bambusicola]